MDQNKGLSAVGYLSFYFMPFILPLIIFFVAKDDVVKHHNKRAFISQLIPIILGIVYIILFFVFAFTTPSNATLEVNYVFESWIFIGFAIFALVTFIIAIWNLIQAIKVLR
ncbi:MAG: DUF4870 domain-containing protein [Solibacillus sp.]|uniref:DUF4870 domain-containing protein n=1 Tax=Solibacillus sp. TaxID=1909654 RepID=UPI0033161A24